MQYADLLDARGATGKVCNEQVASVASNPTNIQPDSPKIRLVVGYSVPVDAEGLNLEFGDRSAIGFGDPAGDAA